MPRKSKERGETPADTAPKGDLNSNSETGTARKGRAAKATAEMEAEAQTQAPAPQKQTKKSQRAAQASAQADAPSTDAALIGSAGTSKTSKKKAAVSAESGTPKPGKKVKDAPAAPVDASSKPARRGRKAAGADQTEPAQTATAQTGAGAVPVVAPVDVSSAQGDDLLNIDQAPATALPEPGDVMLSTEEAGEARRKARFRREKAQKAAETQDAPAQDAPEPETAVSETQAQDAAAGAGEKPRRGRRKAAGAVENVPASEAEQAAGRAELEAEAQAVQPQVNDNELPESVRPIAFAPVEQKASRRGRKAKADAAPTPMPETDPASEESPAEESSGMGVRGRRGRKAAQAAAPAAEPASEPQAAETETTTPDTDAPQARLLGESVPDIETAPDTETVPAETVPDDAPRTGRRGRRGRRAEAEPVAADLEAAPTLITSAPTADDEPTVDAVTMDDSADDEDEEGEDRDFDRTIDLATDPAALVVTEQLRKLGRPVHVRDFERSFTRPERERLGHHRSDLEALLSALVEAGMVIRTRKRTYGLPEAMNLVRGRYQASASGFGFMIPDAGGDDYYIPEHGTMEAWNGDTVLVRPEGRGGRRGDSPRGVVVRVVSRAVKTLVGSLEHAQGYAFLKPDDTRARHRILLAPDGLEGLPDGARVVTGLYWPEQTGEDEVYGELIRVLGNEDDPETETQAVIIKYGLRGEFPEAVLDEAEAIPTEIPASSLEGRLDLRGYNIFTVDGRDAKDFDDAIHIQPTPEGNFVVGVHIADVSNYVRAGQPLDDEAYARATSVYLPGHVLPMLPEHLSNGVCSLVPYQDRLTLSAMIEINIDGDILSVQLTPSVINSKARLTYDEVQAYSEAVATLPEHARALEGDLHLLLKITSRLRQRRLREGALDFKMREVKVDVGPHGQLELVPVREETARGMIEDLMLLANKVVARHLLEHHIPALYRVHEEPTMARFQEVSSAIGRLGLAFPGGEPTPQSYQAVLKKVRGTPQESPVNTLLLRSMQQARYTGENLGHFGLAFSEYLHFTSPIRRYPDLLVHRMLKAALSGTLTDRVKAQQEGRLSEMGRHTSERERTAAEAERDLTKYYQAKWAQEHLGEVFGGTVSGVVASGLFVALENGVEGKIHISNLEDDYYLYIEEAGILKGKTGGRIFRIGERLDIQIAQVNPLARQIEFIQESNMDGNDSKPRARRGGARETAKREKLSVMTPTPRLPRAEQEQEQQASRSNGNGGSGSGRGGYTIRTPERRGGAASSSGGSSSGSSSQGGGKRRIITLDRPRNEHLRPVNVTVQRMYFGDWTLENMPPEEGQGGGYRGGQQGGFRGGRGGSSSGGGFARSGGQGGQQRGSSRSSGGAGERPRQQRSAAQAQTSAPTVSQAAPAQGQPDADGEGKRRRRRRGRRGGNGGAA